MTASVDPRALLGTWSFTRVVDDRRAGEVIDVTGTTTLEEAGEAVRWAEAGVMRRGGAEVPVSRELLLVRRDDGWVVTFADGRDFHPWQVGAEVVHLCGADTYRGRVEVTPDADAGQADRAGWTVTWRVTGPSKDYEMVTRLRRA